jgi:hypothetical protein
VRFRDKHWKVDAIAPNEPLVRIQFGDDEQAVFSMYREQAEELRDRLSEFLAEPEPRGPGSEQAMSVVVTGVDPGGRNVGITARRDAELVDFSVLERKGVAEIPDADWIEEVCGQVLLFVDAFNGAVAVEGVRPPTGFKFGRRDPINFPGLIGTSMVLGAVLAMVPKAIVVPPAQHGLAPLETYPDRLVGDREKVGAGRLRHARSAWDVAGVGAHLLRRRAS